MNLLHNKDILPNRENIKPDDRIEPNKLRIRKLRNCTRIIEILWTSHILTCLMGLLSLQIHMWLKRDRKTAKCLTRDMIYRLPV